MPVLDRETRVTRAFAVTPAIALIAGLLIEPGSAAAQSSQSVLVAIAPAQTAPSTFTISGESRLTRTLTLPQGPVSIVLDVRRADARHGAIQARISIRDGQTTLDEAVIDEEEVETRIVRRLPADHPGQVTLELDHVSDTAQYWLAVSTGRQPDAGGVPVPLYGATQPLPLTTGRSEQGRLDKGEHAYYSATLPAGTYDATLAFTNPNRSITELRGTLRLLDAEGAPLQHVLDIDDVDVSARTSGRFTTPGGVVLFKLYNVGGPRAEYFRTDYVLDLKAVQ